MTGVLKQLHVSLYYDKTLLIQVKQKGNMEANDGALYIGAYHHRIGVPGAGFDNIQIFNKALTIDEITILALANIDTMVD